MSRATDATSDAGGDHRQVSVSHSDAEVVGSNTGELKPNNYARADKDPKIDLTADKPVDISDISSPDRLDEGTAEQAELVAWLTKLADADDRAFTASEQAEIRDEIKELRVQVGRLNRNQQEAIGQLLTEVQHGSERMGRKDWVTYAIGAATSLVIMEIVPPLVLLPLAVHAIHTLGPLFSILDA